MLIVRGEIKVKAFSDICTALIHDLKNEKFLI